jgi:hypothetical protein
MAAIARRQVWLYSNNLGIYFEHQSCANPMSIKCSSQRLRLYLSWVSYFFSGALVCAIATLFVFSSMGVLPKGEPTCSGRPAAAEIFVGITYGCKQLEPSEEASGVVHWVRINVTAPGIAPYVTSKDPVAVSQGWQYRLRRVGDVVASEHLAVAINGTLFSSKSSWWRRMPGDLANAVNPVVADHIII